MEEGMKEPDDKMGVSFLLGSLSSKADAICSKLDDISNELKTGHADHEIRIRTLERGWTKVSAFAGAAGAALMAASNYCITFLIEFFHHL
jgi:hypothetical protein